MWCNGLPGRQYLKPPSRQALRAPRPPHQTIVAKLTEQRSDDDALPVHPCSARFRKVGEMLGIAEAENGMRVVEGKLKVERGGSVSEAGLRGLKIGCQGRRGTSCLWE